MARSAWPKWAGVVLPFAALAAGFLANEFGTDRRMDLLAVPLLGTFFWNLTVYLWVSGSALTALFGKHRSGMDALTAAIARVAGWTRRGPDEGTAVERAATAFRTRWTDLTAPLQAVRISRTLHLGAALFALGLIGGIYARALVIEYRAGWESTFLSPEAVRAVLGVVLGPASQLSGLSIPPLPSITAMRWTGADAGGVNAAPWIHLYLLTIVGFVVVPRLLLALWQWLRLLRLARTLPVAGREDFYVRRLLRANGALPGRVRLTPYAYAPGDETRRRLSAALKAVLGDGTEIRFDEPIEYGAEERWLVTHGVDAIDDYHLMLFTLSSTPEAENHGLLAQALDGKRAVSAKGTILGAIVDETPFRAHFAGQVGIDERVSTRLEAWRRVLAPGQVVPVGVDLSENADDVLAERIEAGLVPDAEMRR